jgi:hypothetical protein
MGFIHSSNRKSFNLFFWGKKRSKKRGIKIDKKLEIIVITFKKKMRMIKERKELLNREKNREKNVDKPIVRACASQWEQ